MVPRRPPGAVVLGIALLAAAIAARPDRAAAQKITVSMTPTTLSFPSPGAGDFVAGGIDMDVTVLVDPKNQNKTWELSIRSLDLDMGGYGKPIGDLRWRMTGEPGWTSLSTGDRTVVVDRGTRSLQLEFRVVLDWAFDVPDTYAADFVFDAAHL